MQHCAATDFWQQYHALSAMVALVLTTVFAGFSSTSFAMGQQEERTSDASPLEIRLGSPLTWENGCLVISLYCTNHASAPLFLPNRGIYIDTSVSESPDETGMKDGVEWVNAYGLSDIGDLGAEPIAPGATVHDEYCLRPTVAVVNRARKTHREMQLRGKLKIKAYYFPTESDWLASKHQHERMFDMSEEELHRLKVLYPQVNTLVSVIPCRKTDCPSVCDKPSSTLWRTRYSSRHI
jgi:hypothetical protein